ncbi:hypothetical protein MKP09_24725 [Niabella ginsengisoli]|uniref:Phospho-N-acetylmuramoyl-pentapeptide-transferase n=1 Tax=Niabella ginsengisoli TaxID=522298 RepID=A0ABS9SR87_9BACT|nr:hypothetical protein [Niabella ginsengisoli]MCH5600886.1 hypothetical protein [Niabella ginsengisoli]
MLYHLFEWFKQQGINFPGRQLMEFQTFRIMMAVLLALTITLIYGKKLINILRARLVGETVRDLGLAGEQAKKAHQRWAESSSFLGLSFQHFCLPA